MTPDRGRQASGASASQASGTAASAAAEVPRIAEVPPRGAAAATADATHADCATDASRANASTATRDASESGNSSTRTTAPPTGDRARASGGQLARWREILYMLVQRDLKARSKQAFLGYLWILIQ